MNAMRKGFCIIILGVLAWSLLMLMGCKDDDKLILFPVLLTGTWQENGYNRGMILSTNGTFQYVLINNGVPGDIEGTGTWNASDVELTLNLTSGRFKWLNSQNNAPISFTFQYSVSGSTLTLTFSILGQVSTTQYTRITEGT